MSLTKWTRGRPERAGSRIFGTAAAALAAGVAAGALALYVMAAGPGNETVAGGTETACPFNAAMAEAISQAARGEIAAVQALDRPFDASAVAFKTRADAPTRLSDFRGKTLLVNLWATWCAPCRAEMPALEALERQLGGADFAVLPINVDVGSAEKPLAFYAEARLEALPFLRDETMAVFTDLKARGTTIGLPVSLIVDAEGCARAVLPGPADWASAEAIRLIKTVMDVDMPVS